MEDRADDRTAAASDLTGSATAVLAGSAVTLVTSLLVRVVMARALSADELGAVVLAIAVVSVAGGIASVGLRPAAARRIAGLLAAGDRRAAAAAARTATAAGAGVGAVAMALVACAPFAAAGRLDAGTSRLLIVVAPVALGLSVGLSMLGVSQGHHDTGGRAVLRDAGGGLCRLAGVVVAAAVFGGMVHIAVGWMVGSLLGEVLFAGYCVGRGWLRGATRAWDPPLVRSLPPYAGVNILNQLRTWLDILLLGVLAPLPVVGLYGVARSVGRVLAMVQGAAAHRFLPSATSAAAHDDSELLTHVYRNAREITFGFIWVPLAVCLLCPHELVVTVFGAEYAPSATPLWVLGIGYLVQSVLGYTDDLLIARGQASAVLVLGTAGTLVSVVAMVLAVPRLGATGAALAASLGFVVRSIAGYRLVERRVRRGLWSAAGVRWLVLATLPALATAALSAILGASDLLRLGTILMAAAPAAVLQALAGLRTWRARRSAVERDQPDPG